MSAAFTVNDAQRGVFLQAAPVTLRHVKVGGQSEPGARLILDQWLVPQPLDGLNAGELGWVSGEYERRRGEHGTFTIRLPNVAGGDGVLHRRRFGVITRRRGLVDDALVYRPGDEWLEVWRGSRPLELGELLFVGTPTQARNDGDVVEVSGVDALWTLNLQRETVCGFWQGASPYEVLERYCHAWTETLVDDFPADLGPNRFVYTTTTTGQSLWTTTRVEDSTDRQAARLRIPANLGTGVIAALDVPAAQRFKPNPGLDWRVETTFFRSELQGATLYVGVEDSYPFATIKPAPDPHYFFRIKAGSVEAVTLREAYDDSGVAARTWYAVTTARTTPAGGPYNVAIERRDRWVFFFWNDELVATMPVSPVDGTQGPQPRIALSSTIAAGPDLWVDVIDFQARQTRKYLVNAGGAGTSSPSDTTDVTVQAADGSGPMVALHPDWRLPGAIDDLPATGLIASIFDETGKGAVEAWRALAPLTEPNARKRLTGLRLLSGLADRNEGPTTTDFVPFLKPESGLASNVSMRVAGAVWLDFDTFGDFAFRAAADDRVRLWVGRTRLGAAIVNDWAVGPGHPINALPDHPLDEVFWLKSGGTAWDPSTLASSAPGAPTGLPPMPGARSGWYPIVVEWLNLGGRGDLIVEYCRGDQPGVWRALGAGDYGHAVRSTSGLLAFYPFGFGHARTQRGTVGSLEDQGPSQTHGTQRDGVQRVAPGPDGRGAEPATDFPTGTNSYADVASPPVNVTTGLTVEAWALADDTSSGTSGIGAIARRDGGASGSWSLRRDFDGWSFFVSTPTSGGAKVVKLVGSVAVGRWQHVVGTWDGSNVRLYVDGALAAGPVACVGTLAAIASSTALYFGVSNPLLEPFNGVLSNVGVYNRALSLAEVQAHRAAMLTPTQSVLLAPLGTYDEAVRLDSHYEQLQALREQFGLDFALEPKSLESGMFPGYVRGSVRVGRDTDLVIDRASVTDPELTVNAEEVADRFLVDAAGLADPNGGGQITKEAGNFQTMQAPHLLTATQYDSLADLSIPELVEQRAAALLALRGAPWEEVSASPDGARRLADTFTLTGALADFAWTPGDAARLSMPELDLEDDAPRPILSAGWPIFPAGVGRPTIGWRQRPRSDRELLRRIIRRTLNSDRNYQGALTKVAGSIGKVGTSTAGADATSRVALPSDLAKIVRAELVVLFKSDASAMGVTVAGDGGGPVVTPIAVDRPGRFDVSGYVARGGATSFYTWNAFLTGGTGSAEYMLELVVAF